MSEGLQRIEHNKESSSEVKTASKPKKKRGCFLRVIAFLILAVITLAVALAIFVQTQWFRNIALDQGLKYVNSNLVKPGSQIYASRLEGNLLSEIRLLNAGIIVKNDTLVKLDTILINYQLFPIFNKKINVSLVELVNPSILFTQVRDENDSLKWNYTQIFKSEPDTIAPDTTAFDWNIALGKLLLKNGQYSSISNIPINTLFSQLDFKNSDSLNIDYLQLRELNIELGAEYTPDYKFVDIKAINFKSNSYFNLYELSGKAEVNSDDKITEVTNFKIITDSSSIVINKLRMEDFDPFGETVYENFDSNEVVIDMVADNFYAKDLLYFLPQLNFLSGDVHLELQASGNYGNILIDKLILNTPYSHYDFKGRIQNLQEPSKLYFNITGKDLVIDPRDTRYIIPGIPVPDYSYLGVVRVPYITYVGEPTRFNSDFDIYTEVGSIRGNTYLDLTQSQIVYKTDFTGSHLNLGKFLKDKSLESDVNLTVKGEGRGFDLATMVANMNYDIQNSRIFNTNISASAGQVNLNNGIANIDFYFNSNTLKSKAKGQINIRNLENPSYDIQGDIANLDISTFTGDQSLKSNLTFAFDLNGSGINPKDINGNFDIQMQQSTFTEYFIPPAEIDAQISKSGGQTSLDLKSDFADITAQGNFDFMDLGVIISSNLDKLTYELKKYALSKDTISGPETITTTANNPVVTSTPDANMTYTIVLKDLTPVAYLYDTSFSAKGTIKGTLVNSNNTLTLTADADLSSFGLKDTSISVFNPKLKFDFKNNPTEPELTNFASNLNFVADSIYYITSDSAGVNMFVVDSIYTNFKFVNYTNNYQIYGRSDTSYVLTTSGSLDILPGGYATNTDLLYLKFNGYKIHNNNKFTVAYIQNDTDKFISFKDFEISTGKWVSNTTTTSLNTKNVSVETSNISNDTTGFMADADTWISDNQRLGLEGYYSLDKNSNLVISANNIKMATLQKLMDPQTRPENLIGGGLRRVEIDYTGHLSDPKFYVEINSDPLIMRRKILGRFDAILGYDSTNLRTDISFYNDRNLGSLLIKGVMPILIVLDGDTSRASDTVFINKQVDLDVAANHFKIDVLSPFIPLVTGLTGSLNGDVKVSGMSDNPLLTGGLNLDSSQFVFNMTRNTYELKADFKTEGQKLILSSSRMNSIFEPSQYMSTTGYIDFTNLKLNNMEFVMNGTLQAFDKSTGMSKFGIGGDLVVGSNSHNPIKISGNANELVLTGNVILVDGNVTMNPVTGKEYDIYNDDFTYSVLIDSSSFGDTLQQYLVYEIDNWSKRDYNSLNPFERLFVPADSSKIPVASSSKFIYDIKLLTNPGKYIYLNFIVNEQTKNEFFGDVAVDLSMNNRAGDNNVQAYGAVTLGPSAYYRFYRNFDASGDIKFRGELTNPELNITAEFTTTNTDPNDPSAIDEYKVEMKVTGTAQELDPIAFTVYKNGANIGGSDPTSDALSVILFGRTQLTGSERSSVISNLGLNVGTMFVSDYVGNLIQNILPFVKTVGFNYDDSQTGSVAQNTNLNLTAQFGDATIRFGGAVFEDVSNTNVIVTYPIGKLINENLGNNLILQFERIYNITGGTTILNPQERLGLILQYKIKF